jgi:hypothetical protein
MAASLDGRYCHKIIQGAMILAVVAIAEAVPPR